MRHFQPNLMSALHNHGRPNNLSIALDIALNDILVHGCSDPFGSSRFAKKGQKGGNSDAFFIGYYAFFAWVAGNESLPPMGEFGQNPSNEMVRIALDVAYMNVCSPVMEVEPDDLWKAKRGFVKANNLVDQMRMTFYRAGPRPETWSS